MKEWQHHRLSKLAKAKVRWRRLAEPKAIRLGLVRLEALVMVRPRVRDIRRPVVERIVELIGTSTSIAALLAMPEAAGIEVELVRAGGVYQPANLD